MTPGNCNLCNAFSWNDQILLELATSSKEKKWFLLIKVDKRNITQPLYTSLAWCRVNLPCILMLTIHVYSRRGSQSKNGSDWKKHCSRAKRISICYPKPPKCHWNFMTLQCNARNQWRIRECQCHSKCHTIFWADDSWFPNDLTMTSHDFPQNCLSFLLHYTFWHFALHF